MRPSTEWREDDVLQLVELQTKESSSLEYKQCAALRTEGAVYNRRTRKYEEKQRKQSRDKIVSEISKDVSSFANADGGTIIYGVVEDNHVPLFIDHNPFLPTEVSREWLENVIDSNIRRKIQGVKINQVELTSANPGKVIYTVCIPQSLQGAHQANDYCYYQRRNFKAEPMEDYQVRDVMNRFNFPLIDSEFEFSNISLKGNEHRYGFGLTLTNIGNVTAINFGLDIHFPEVSLHNFTVNRFTASDQFSEGSVVLGGHQFRRICYRNFGTDYVLFPSESITVFNVGRANRMEYVVNRSNHGECGIQKIRWTIFADNMPPKSEETSIHEIF
jgi:hypothetical protein